MNYITSFVMVECLWVVSYTQPTRKMADYLAGQVEIGKKSRLSQPFWLDFLVKIVWLPVSMCLVARNVEICGSQSTSLALHKGPMSCSSWSHLPMNAHLSTPESRM